MATQELLRLAEANPGGLASLDPVNDLQLKSIDVVQASMRLRVLQDSLKEFICVHSPRFPEQVGVSIATGAVFIEITLLFSVFLFSFFLNFIYLELKTVCLFCFFQIFNFVFIIWQFVLF